MYSHAPTSLLALVSPMETTLGNDLGHSYGQGHPWDRENWEKAHHMGSQALTLGTSRGAAGARTPPLCVAPGPGAGRPPDALETPTLLRPSFQRC